MSWQTTAPSRRKILETGAKAMLGALGAVALPRIALSQPVYKRKSIDAFTPDELEAYKHAIKIAIDRGTADPARKEGYKWQADLHDDSGRVRPDNSVGACEHASEQFLPWHRAHLVGFERILRASDPPRTANVTLPYWDWTKPPTGARVPRAFEDTTSPLFNSGRSDGDPPVSFPAATIAAFVKEPDWSLFAGRPKRQAPTDPPPSSGPLERGPHNGLHGAIGTTMGDASTASEDPIYWSFHAYIDLIWSRWQRLNTSAVKPQPFANGRPTMWVEPFTPKVSDLARTAELGYEYDYDFNAADGPAPILVSDVPGQQRTMNLPTAERPSSITARPTAPVAPASRKLLRVGEISPRSDVTYQLGVFVHPAGFDIDAASDSERNKYLVETITIWRSGGHHPDAFDAFVDVTSAVKAIGNDNWSVTIRPNDVAQRGPASVTGARRPLGSGRALFKSLELQER